MSTKETTAGKRTAGEWIVDEDCVHAGRTAIATMVDEGFGFAPWDERAANAAFIVRAVNAHDELVSALKAVAAGLKQPVQHTAVADDIGSLRAQVNILRGDCRFALETANRALALVEGGDRMTTHPPKSAPDGNPERLRANVAVVHTSPYGVNEVIGFEMGERGGWRRIDRYTSHLGGSPILERRFVLDSGDTSPQASHYGEHANCEYHPRCSCCWLGFSHSLALHNNQAKDRVCP